MATSKLDQLKLLYRQQPRLTYPEIAEKLELRTDYLRAWIRKLQIAEVLPLRYKTGHVMPMTKSQHAQLQVIIGLRKKDYSWKRIGQHLGMSGQAVCNYVRDHFPELLGQKIKAQQRNPPLTVSDELQRLYYQFPRLTLATIADRLGITLRALQYAITKARKAKLLHPRVGNGMPPNLNEKQLRQIVYIVQRRKDGITTVEIAAELGIHRVTVSRILSRQSKRTFDC